MSNSDLEQHFGYQQTALVDKELTVCIMDNVLHDSFVVCFFTKITFSKNSFENHLVLTLILLICLSRKCHQLITSAACILALSVMEI